jgi:hypothetical protein
MERTLADAPFGARLQGTASIHRKLGGISLKQRLDARASIQIVTVAGFRRRLNHHRRFPLIHKANRTAAAIACILDFQELITPSSSFTIFQLFCAIM